MVFDRLRKRLRGSLNDEYSGDEYLELDLGAKEKDSKVLVKLFFLKNYEDVNEILTSLREGYTIAVIDIKTLRQKDSIELKRAVSKIKKTTEALEGSIAGFGENIVIVTPSFAKIHKETIVPKEDKKTNKFEY
ncbi:MAG: cell division protein SepF [Nanoarchaeota archaeon]